MEHARQSAWSISPAKDPKHSKGLLGLHWGGAVRKATLEGMQAEPGSSSTQWWRGKDRHGRDFGGDVLGCWEHVRPKEKASLGKAVRRLCPQRGERIGLCSLKPQTAGDPTSISVKLMGSPQPKL